MSELVTISRHENNVAVVRLDRPKVNALSIALLNEIHEAFDSLAQDLPNAVVLWGGEKYFAAGAEISEFGTPEQGRIVNTAFRETLDAIETLPRIVIAAIAGYALGGGCELALACDFRIATPTAKLGFPEITLGIIPGGGGTQRLPRLVGTSVAKKLLLTGHHIDAVEASGIGLIDRVVDAEHLYDEAVAMANEFAQGPLVAQGLLKRAVHDGFDQELPAALSTEGDAFVDVFNSNDAKIGLQSFRENGPGQAKFTGK